MIIMFIHTAFDTNFSNQGVRTPNLSNQGVQMKIKESEIKNIKFVYKIVVVHRSHD